MERILFPVKGRINYKFYEKSLFEPACHSKYEECISDSLDFDNSSEDENETALTKKDTDGGETSGGMEISGCSRF